MDKQKVLIVDDVATNVTVLEEILKKKYQVMAANSGEKAVQIAREKSPHLILMDVKMPEMDGFTTCRILKGDPRTTDIPLIFITALSRQEDIVKGFEAGGQDYITKPFNPLELFLRIQNHLEINSSREKLKRYAEELELKNQELKEALERLETLATMDPLTDLINRRCILEKINEEAERCRRYGGTFSLAIGDIDNFKAINDAYGHHCGDAVIKKVAALLGENVRSSDSVSRWGGEEFLLLFPATGYENARVACNKVRGIVEKTPIRYNGLEIFVTITVGVAGGTADFDINAMVKAADEALYRGKNSGKNKVT